MKRLPTLPLLLLPFITVAQTQSTDLLALEPEMANGYVIIDSKKANDLGVVDLEVSVWADELISGSVASRLIETFSVVDPLYGHADPVALSSRAPKETIRYQLTGYDSNGFIVFDHDGLRPGGWGWPEVCRSSCNSLGYAWAVVAFSDGAQTFMELHDGTENGSFYYFYVKNTDWPVFSVHDPTDFGFGVCCWSQLFTNTDLTDIISFNVAPPGARDLFGYNIGNVAARGIRKDKGPWRGLDAFTENYTQPSEVCGEDELVAIYNSDSFVQNTMNIMDMDPLSCMAFLQSGNGSAPGCLTLPIQGNLNAWVQSVLSCFGISDLNSTVLPQLLHSTSVIQWANGQVEPLIDIVYPTEKDPKLVSIPRTHLQPGLYEFRIALTDGRIIRHFEEFQTSTTITASFAPFINANIYPVPVTRSSFAIDFDLPGAMSMNITILNNNGTVYHAESLSFDLPGRNKHVVRMTSQWPAGLYHAVFQFPDGSSNSLSGSSKNLSTTFSDTILTS